METKDLIIYKGIENAAKDIFNKLEIPAGKYTAKDICKLPISAAFPAGFDETDIIRVSVDTFECSFPAGAVFNTLSQLETAWNIPSAQRAQFIKTAAAAPVAVQFELNALIKETAKARETEKDKKELRPNMQYICIDTVRRAAVASNGHVLTAVSVPDMYVSQDAEKEYLISADLLKAGKGTFKIDTAKNCTINGQTFAAVDMRFPNWESVLHAVSEDEKLYLGKETIKQLKKEINAVSKTNDYGHVSIIGISGNNYITVSAVNYDENKQTETNVSLPQPCPFDFNVLVDNKGFAAVPAAVDTVYIHPFKNGAGCLIFAAPGCLFLLMPLYDENLKFAPVPENAETRAAVDVAGFAALNAENTPAAVAAVNQDEETAPAKETAAARAVAAYQPAAVEIITADYVPAVDEEIKAAVNGALLAYYWPAKFAGCLRDLFGRAYLTKNNIIFDELNGTFKTRGGKLFAVAAESLESAEMRVLYQDAPEKEIPVLFGTDAEKFILAQRAQDEETARAAFAEDEETPAADSMPADKLKIWGISENVETAANVPAPVAAQLNILNSCKELNTVAPGLIMKHKYQDNLYIVIIDYTNKGYKTKEITIYNSRKRPDLKTKYFNKLDVCPSEKALFDYCAAAADLAKVLFILDEETKKLAAPVAAADSVPAQDEETRPAAKETAPAVQDETPAAVNHDEETAPAVAVSLPVPVSAVSVWYAVYHFGKLENVYFSKLLADEEIINSLFAAGETKDLLAVPSPAAAPAVLPRRADLIKRAPAVAAFADCLTLFELSLIIAQQTAAAVQDETPAAQDEETPAAVAVSLQPVAAYLPQPCPFVLPADSLPVQDEETRPAAKETAPAVAADSVPAAEDEETAQPVPFASLFAIIPEIWETAAPAADSVPVQDETPAAVDYDEETAPAVAAYYLAANFARRARRVFNLAAALLCLFMISAAPLLFAPAFEDAQETAQPVPAFNHDEETAPAVPVSVAADSILAAPADSVPAVAKKQPRNSRKRARRAAADSLPQPAPADSVLAVAADSILAAPADSVPADSVLAVPVAVNQDEETPAADSVPVQDEETAAAVQDAQETAAPAAEDEETETNGAPADSVPADSVPAANSPAPAVPAAAPVSVPSVPAALLLLLML